MRLAKPREALTLATVARRTEPEGRERRISQSSVHVGAHPRDSIHGLIRAVVSPRDEAWAAEPCPLWREGTPRA